MSGALVWLGRLREELARAKGLMALVSTAGLALLAACLALALGPTAPLRTVENFLYDLRIGLLGPAASNEESIPITIVKIDEAAMQEMREASDCGCISPIDRVWLGELILDIDRLGARVIGVDVLFDDFRSTAEFARFAQQAAQVSAPVVAAVDPGRRPGIDYPVVPSFTYADALVLVKDVFDDGVRFYDPAPEGRRSFGAAILDQLGVETPSERFAIRFRSPRERVDDADRGSITPVVPADLVDELPDGALAGRIVLIGRVTRASASDQQVLPEDMHFTPLRFRAGHEDGTPGVEIHAHVLSQLMQGDRVGSLGWLGDLLVVLAAALGGAWLGRATHSWWVAALSALGGMAAAVLLGFGAYGLYGVMIPLATTFLAFALSFFLLSRLVASQLQGERTLFASTLERYLAPQVIRRIVEGEEPVRIGADRRTITVMVTDIENFSTLVAQTPLEEFETIINGYFDGLIEVLWKHEAMVDKLTGDGLIALFGAPVASADHAERALACAKDMDAFSEAYRRQVKARHGRALGCTRIGLHSGEGLVGNFGGARRFNYTAYGQVVVIAARLEAANKEVGARMLFSQACYEAAGAPSQAQALGSVTLKGVPEPVKVYSFALQTE